MSTFRKRTIVRRLVLACALLAGALYMKGCESGDTDLPLICIMQHEPATWADDVRDGFMAGMAANGKQENVDYRLEYQHGSGTTETLSRIAENFRSRNPTLVFAISTQAAQAAVRASSGKYPVLFGAVTDPVDAGLVENMQVPGKNVSGTSDQWPVREQLLLFKEMNPSFAHLGVVHDPGEDNSLSNMKIVRMVTADIGWELSETSVSNTNEVMAATQTLAAKCDGIYIPASNTVLQATESVVKAARERQLPVVAGVANSVRQGAHATYSISYYEIGKLNAKQAYNLLWNSMKAQEMPVVVPADYDLVFNRQAFTLSGIAVPSGWEDRAYEIIEGQ